MLHQDGLPKPAGRLPPSVVRRPWGVLVLALGLVLLSAAQAAYRFTLPTDGWAVLPSDDLDQPGWVYLTNLVGAHSGLQRDDKLLAVAGRPLAGQAGVPLEPPRSWAAGQTVQLRVLRQGQPLELAVPVVHWTPAALWRLQLVGLESLVGFVGGLILTALALYALWRRPEVPATRPLLVLGATFLAIQISHLLPDGLSAQFDHLAFYAHGVFGFVLFGALLGPSLLAFALQFPRPKRVVQRHPWLGPAPFGVGLLVGAALLTGLAPTFGWLATLGMLLASLACLIHAGVTQRDAISRAQLQWAGCGLLGGIAPMLLVYPAASGLVTNPLLAQLMGAGFQLGFTLIGVGLTVAVLRYQLFDIAPVINRALVYGTLTAGVIGVYVAVVGYLGWLFRAEGSLALSLIATGIVAVGFAPARQVVQQGVNRLLYGERDEPYRVLSRLGQQLETAAAPSAVLTRAAATLAHSLKVPYVAIVHHDESGSWLLAAVGEASAAATQVPLMYAGTSVGALVVAPRDPDTPLSSADQRLLAEVARPLGVAAHAAALQARLEQSRLRLVTERGEARRRLGGDLHDLIGHQLAGVARQVERAAHMLGDDQARARALLAEITQRLHGVTDQVRGLAHELFPPELALLGLVGAIRERALAYSHLPTQVVAAEPLRPLPAEVEAAVYAITLEALTNVDKHARASHCTVCLQANAEPWAQGAQQLVVTISDDGVGFPDGRATGVGVLSMQARAAEIGGTCEVTSRLGEGTSVTIRIPYGSVEGGGAQ